MVLQRIMKKNITGCGIDFFSLLLSAKYNYKLWKLYNRQWMGYSESCKEEGKLVRDLWTWGTSQQQSIILTPHPEGKPVTAFITLTQPSNKSWPRKIDSSLNQNTIKTRQGWQPWQEWWITRALLMIADRGSALVLLRLFPTKRSEVVVR